MRNCSIHPLFLHVLAAEIKALIISLRKIKVIGSLTKDQMPAAVMRVVRDPVAVHLQVLARTVMLVMKVLLHILRNLRETRNQNWETLKDQTKLSLSLKKKSKSLNMSLRKMKCYKTHLKRNWNARLLKKKMRLQEYRRRFRNSGSMQALQLLKRLC